MLVLQLTASQFSYRNLIYLIELNDCYLECYLLLVNSAIQSICHL